MEVRQRPRAVDPASLHVDSQRRSGRGHGTGESTTEWLTVRSAGSIFNRMVEAGGAALSAVFRALGDPTRRAMLCRLSEGERTVGELAEPFLMSLAAASKHVKVLERAGLVRRTVQGRQHRCRLDARGLLEAQRWLAFYQRFWTERLDALLAVPRPAPEIDRK
jgi:DNA-binding transcriptional ArsR family regulator